ncbi:hypothetical protein V8J82_01650 [Gymnodinialimonas sp. 2305UL16-5]|uniref:hypothetical protein n=1 Tax=Gymnodinialimonas mytili TaxID=3126503 RepID=UPI00309A8F41
MLPILHPTANESRRAVALSETQTSVAFYTLVALVLSAEAFRMRAGYAAWMLVFSVMFVAFVLGSVLVLLRTLGAPSMDRARLTIAGREGRLWLKANPVKIPF